MFPGYVSVGKLRRFVSTLKLMLKASLTEINMDVLDDQIFDRITDAESFHVSLFESIAMRAHPPSSTSVYSECMRDCF